MCDALEPVTVDGAVGMLDRALDTLNTTDTASLPASVQARLLRALERAEAKHTAARARVLTAFAAQSGYEDDGQGSARVWLKWQTRVTKGAAAGAVGWARRLADHPAVAEALAAGQVSASWARAICDWTDRLPAASRDDADAILLTAASGGAELADLSGLAEQMYHRFRPDGDDRDRFDDRGVWLGLTLGGVGRLDGDLTSGCAAALAAVLETLGKKAGPEDSRTAIQRRHDALEEACRRLIAAGMIPARAGQYRQLMLHITLGQLRGLTSGAEAAWAAAAREHGWLTGPDAEAAACDASIIPVVTGHLDPAILDQLVEVFLAGQVDHTGRTDRTGRPAPEPLCPDTRRRLRNALLGLAVEALSGPGGLAAHLRAALDDVPMAPISLPLDIGPAGETIPAHLRRAAAVRHPHCAFPGCEQPASVCDIHHLIPRARGGPTALSNLVPLCGFHHLIVIHRWGWTLTLHADGTTTATSPDGQRILHSHSPPADAA
ncbi:MAG TPA: DUF222 domain-containing protein [Streptosporangiaceae bacterium]